MTLRAIVVDDEPLAREGVELMLREHDVEIVASCADGSEAVHAIREAAPDVVFLDIRMPGLSGFDVIESIRTDAMPVVVFVTAYEEHAVRAFRANAADYLLKPIDAAALAQSLERVRSRLENDIARDSARYLSGLMQAFSYLQPADGATALRGGKKIALRENRRVRFVDPDSIIRVAASGDYVTIYTSAEEFLLRESLSTMQSRLAAQGFCRIHRSHIVNCRRVCSLEHTAEGSCSVVLDDATRLPVSRTWKGALIAALACPDPGD